MSEDWTVGVGLMHLAFWDGLSLAKFEEWERTGEVQIPPMRDLVDGINQAMLPWWRLILALAVGPGEEKREVMPQSSRLSAALLAGLLLLNAGPRLAAERSKGPPRSAPEEPSIFAPAAPPETPSRPASPSPEVCAKVREARLRHKYYMQVYGVPSQLRLLAPKQELLLTQMRYAPSTVEAMMADRYRSIARAEQEVRDAKASYDRIADDLIGKVETPWPACEAPK